MIKSLSLISNVLNIVYTKKNQKMSKNDMLKAIEENSSKINAEITKIEANQQSLFKSGWRPLIGWICGVNLLYTIMVKDLLNYIIVGFKIDLPLLPVINNPNTMELVYALLGLGAFRTYEKMKGLK